MIHLLDTHTVIWALADNPELSPKARELISTEKSIFASIASIWEIGIKQSLKRTDFGIGFTVLDIANECRKLDITILPITPEDVQKVVVLSFIHRDPFDRIIIAQAICNDLTLLTKDHIIPQYNEVRPCGNFLLPLLMNGQVTLNSCLSHQVHSSQLLLLSIKNGLFYKNIHTVIILLYIIQFLILTKFFDF